MLLMERDYARRLNMNDVMKSLTPVNIDSQWVITNSKLVPNM